jgi:hypothetical protein
MPWWVWQLADGSVCMLIVDSIISVFAIVTVGWCQFLFRDSGRLNMACSFCSLNTQLGRLGRTFLHQSWQKVSCKALLFSKLTPLILQCTSTQCLQCKQCHYSTMKNQVETLLPLPGLTRERLYDSASSLLMDRCMNWRPFAIQPTLSLTVPPVSIRINLWCHSFTFDVVICWVSQFNTRARVIRFTVTQSGKSFFQGRAASAEGTTVFLLLSDLPTRCPLALDIFHS